MLVDRLHTSDEQRHGVLRPRVASSTGPPVLMLSDVERAERIDEFWSLPQTRTFAELMIHCEEDRTLGAVVFGLLRRWPRSSA